MTDTIKIIEPIGEFDRIKAERVIYELSQLLFSLIKKSAVIDRRFSLYSIRTAERLANILNPSSLEANYHFYVVVKLTRNLNIKGLNLPEEHNGVGVIYTV